MMKLSGRLCKRSLIASSPSLLNPIRFIKAWLRFNLNNRGRGLPLCGSGVTVPISMNEKPMFFINRMATAFLSNPPAIPTGCLNLILKRVDPDNPEEFLQAILLRKIFPIIGKCLKIKKVNPWINSGSKINRIGRMKFL